MTLNPLLDLATRQGLELQPQTLIANDSGLDFAVTYAQDIHGTTWVLRQPRRPEVWASAERELHILNSVRPHLPVAVPDWKIATPELIAYPRLGGEPIGTIDPELGNYVWVIDPQALPEAFVISLATTLAALHNLVLTPAMKGAWPAQSMAQIRQELAANMEHTQNTLTVPEPVWERWQRWVHTDQGWPPQSLPLHGDLHPGHLLIGGDQQLSGILDWTEGAWGDSSVDFVSYCGCFGTAALETLLKHYQRAGGPVWPGLQPQIEHRWSALAVSFVAYARQTGNDAYLPAAQAMLDAQNSL